MSQRRNIKITRSHRRSISLRILPDHTLEVRAPLFTPDFFINRFISQHTDWIERRMKVLEKRPLVAKRHYVHGEEFWYLGKPHVLTIGRYPAIHAKDSKINFPQALAFRIQKELTNWYMSQAKQIITERVEWNANVMNISYGSIMFSDTKSKWGSCTHDNRLQFNWRLVMAPPLVINYVVIHELVHFIEKNHSRDFWRNVRAMNPSYKQQIKWLKTYGDALTL